MDSNEIMLLSVITVVFFCLSCWVLITQVRKPLNEYSGSYSRRALRIKKAYGVASWAIMSMTLLGSLVISFYQVFTQL
ncbi:MAG: hypothetical protein ACK5V3_16835 [Bdellovibrionales bacterium]